MRAEGLAPLAQEGKLRGEDKRVGKVLIGAAYLAERSAELESPWSRDIFIYGENLSKREP